MTGTLEQLCPRAELGARPLTELFQQYLRLSMPQDKDAITGTAAATALPAIITPLPQSPPTEPSVMVRQAPQPQAAQLLGDADLAESDEVTRIDASVPAWLWRADDGKFAAYEGLACEVIEAAYRQVPATWSDCEPTHFD